MEKITFIGKKEIEKRQDFKSITLTNCPELGETIFFTNENGGGYGETIKKDKTYSIDGCHKIYFESWIKCTLEYEFSK